MSARSAALVASAISFACSFASPASAAPDDSLVVDSWGRVGAGTITPSVAPRLVVVLLFDQFRADFLDRFRSVFTADGFLRLEREGTRYTDCTIPYAQTLTAPGHATLLTGAPPSVHGIIGNGWYEAREGRAVSADFDPRARAVGSNDKESSSPWRLRAETVGDVLKSATRGRGKVIGISDKARAAILPTGYSADAAYWLDDSTGHMQSSTYYMSQLPAWVVAANAGRHAADASAQPWRPLLPAQAYAPCWVAKGASTFPHRFTKDGRIDGARATVATPWTLTSEFAFARQAVEGEKLGADDVPDLLSLSISVTDRVGHLFGPDSPESLDLAARADREVAAFLRFLDARVGRGRYAVVVTSDHGAAPTPSLARHFEVSPRDSLGAISDSSLAQWASAEIAKVYGGRARHRVGDYVTAAGEGQLWLDRDSLAWAGIGLAEAAQTLADSAFVFPWLETGFATSTLGSRGPDEPLRHAVTLGAYPGRSGDVVFIARPFAFFGSGGYLRGDHGTPYRYDTHVPLVFWGAGVSARVVRRPVTTLDIAPTVSALYGIEPPAQSQGHALAEIAGASGASGSP
ncbi:MAG TPA: alkaline phosphatase family protein [Candidatus Eisenbacteria bacterium]|nr:alkaline phosphatase family protein [Candidatus Eisenbacteria bacterium]